LLQRLCSVIGLSTHQPLDVKVAFTPQKQQLTLSTSMCGGHHGCTMLMCRVVVSCRFCASVSRTCAASPVSGRVATWLSCSAPVLLLGRLVNVVEYASHPTATCQSTSWSRAALSNRQQVVSRHSRTQHLQYTSNIHYAPCKALVAGTASSLPSPVLRSMLKQRRILMRMH